jgi:histidinol-phosphate aminotransferase
MPSTPDFPAHIRNLRPYVPGLPIDDLARRLDVAPARIAKLASNENPLGPSPRALAALAQAALDVSRYPDNDCSLLTPALAAHCGVPADWLVTGAGSESVIGMAASALLAPGRTTVHAQYSFQAYANAAQRTGARAVVVPSPDFIVDLAALRRQISDEVALVYIANPGNPTGTGLPAAALEDFLGSVPASTVVLLDEAYFEYLPHAARPDSIAWVRRHPNLLVTRTFSKAYGLAGLRVGYGIAQPALADMLRRLRAPFSVSQAAQVAAAAALGDLDFLARTLDMNRRGGEQLTAAFDALGLRHVPSVTNFILVEVGDGAGMAQRLERHGLIVRPVNSYGLARWLRVSIGTHEENARLIEALGEELAASVA